MSLSIIVMFWSGAQFCYIKKSLLRWWWPWVHLDLRNEGLANFFFPIDGPPPSQDGISEGTSKEPLSGPNPNQDATCFSNTTNSIFELFFWNFFEIFSSVRFRKLSYWPNPRFWNLTWSKINFLKHYKFKLQINKLVRI